MAKDSNFTTCANEWQKFIVQEMGNYKGFIQIPVFSFPANVKALHQLVSGYMCGASCVVDGKTYEARSRRADTLIEIAKEFEKTPVYLYNIIHVPARKTYAINKETFEPLNEKIMTSEYYMVRYAEV